MWFSSNNIKINSNITKSLTSFPLDTSREKGEDLLQTRSLSTSKERERKCNKKGKRRALKKFRLLSPA